MFFNNINCCAFNFPCPIATLQNLACQGGNSVINPIIGDDYGFFANTAPGAIATDVLIPLSLTLSDGSLISASTDTVGAISLLPGTYEVSYFAEATVPAGGSVSVALENNDVLISGSLISSNLTAGNVTNLSQTIMFTITQNATLSLVNFTAESVTFSNASIAIKAL